MTSTRESRNTGMIEDAVATIGATITVAEHLVGVLCNDLSEDVNEADLATALDDVRKSHDKLGEVLGL